MNRVFILVAILVVIILAAFGVMYFRETGHLESIDSFEECADNGYPVMESYPRQCMTPDGRSFTEDISENNEDETNNNDDLIRVETPEANSTISSPLTVRGEARGTWYFEASFPVRLLLENGQEIAITPAQAEGEWMTEEFVPFEAVLEFEEPVAAQAGTLILMKDNPSGLPEFDRSISIPVMFEGTETQTSACVVTGCSGQICADEEVASTCEFREEYVCYRNATCERQANGQCGWTETPQLAQCLQASAEVSL